MQKTKLLLILLVFGLNQKLLKAQNFPKLGNDTLLDVCAWNVEWLGDATNGPSDEALQLSNVSSLISKTGFDIVALEEVSNVSTYNTLSTQLAGTYNTYISTFSATQKMALYWRKSMFEVIGFETKNILTTENYVFASRPPLQVCLKTLGGTKTDTIYFIVVHLKANGDQESYERRKSASAQLKTYIETTLSGKKTIILGDWNDDLDASTYQSAETPFKNFLSASYTFPSKELTDAGKSSYAFSNTMLDHILNSKTLDSFYYKNSARVFDNAGNYADNFSQSTSDHWPVYAFYNWKKLTTRVIPAALNETLLINLKVYPNPVRDRLWIECDKPLDQLMIMDLQGKAIAQSAAENNGLTRMEIDLSHLANGIYFLQVKAEEEQEIIKVQVMH